MGFFRSELDKAKALEQSAVASMKAGLSEFDIAFKLKAVETFDLISGDVGTLVQRFNGLITAKAKEALDHISQAAEHTKLAQLAQVEADRAKAALATLAQIPGAVPPSPPAPPA